MAGETNVMQDSEDGHAVAHSEIPQQLHDLDLVAQVEVDGRLVEEQQPRLLGDRHGQDGSCRSPRDSSRTSRPRRSLMPTRSMAASTAA